MLKLSALQPEPVSTIDGFTCWSKRLR